MLTLIVMVLFLVTGGLHFLYMMTAFFFKPGEKRQLKSNIENDLTVQHVVCFHNESHFIKRKLENCYSIDYPKVSHVFVNDNSSDNTLELLEKYKKENTLVLNNNSNIGKNQSQIKAVSYSDSDLILFTDANVFLEEDALLKLVEHFDQTTGGVTGNVLVKTESDKVEFSGKYWNLEKIIKDFQTKFGCIIGFDGGFYCVKRENYNVKRENELSDFETAFLIFEQHKKVKYASSAKAVEVEKRTLKSSFTARMRASNRVFWSYKRIFKYINRLEKKVVFHFILHKLMRYAFIIIFVLFLPYIIFFSFTKMPWLLILFCIPYVLRFTWESIALFIGGLIALSGKEFVSWSDKKI